MGEQRSASAFVASFIIVETAFPAEAGEHLGAVARLPSRRSDCS